MKRDSSQSMYKDLLLQANRAAFYDHFYDINWKEWDRMLKDDSDLLNALITFAEALNKAATRRILELKKTSQKKRNSGKN